MSIKQLTHETAAAANHSTWGEWCGVTLERAAPGDIYPSYATVYSMYCNTIFQMISVNYTNDNNFKL